ncbi:MAG: metallopeptidase TldD-related protein [Myxococcota bacterium]
MNRRRFLQAGAAGMSSLTMPGFLSGCKHQLPQAVAANAPLPDNPFHDWFGVDAQVLRAVFQELSAHGADFADAYFQHKRAISVSMEDGLISRASTNIDQGVGLRVVTGDQTGYAFTEELTLDAMLEAARTAASIAAGQPITGPEQFSFPEVRGRALYALSVPWSQVGIDKKLPMIETLEQMARGQDPAVTKVSVRWTDEEERILVATLDGMLFTDVRPMSRLWCTVTAEKNGNVVTNSANLAGRRGLDYYTHERLQELANKAVERTIRLFDARRPPAGEMPVVLAAGASGILLHEAVGHGLEADFNRKGVSIYSDMIGKQVAPDFVTVVDSGDEPNERGSLSFDDEGQAAGHTTLIENGRLVSYMHDQISAKHYGVQPTGSGRRQSFRHVPMPRMRCTYMENGPHTREEIIAAVDKGIIAETFTNGQVQIGAGDFTFYIKNGWLIEGGKVTAPIKDVNIIGNGPQALRDVTMAAADFSLDTGGWTCGKDGQGVPVSQGLPTVLVSKMTVGGVNG